MSTPLVSYKGYYTTLPVPSVIMEEWKRTLIAEQANILNALKTRIPNETTFKRIIAETSQKAWEAFINPEWVNADFIKLKRAIKISGAYNDWLSGVEECFKEGGYFSQRVESKASKFGKAKVTLGSVGLRYLYGRGIAVKAIGVLTGHIAVLNDIKSPDEFTGNVVSVFPPRVANFVRPQAVAIITQGLVLAGYAEDAGLPILRNEVLKATNDTLTNSVLKQVDTTKYSATLEVGYDATKDKIYVLSSATQV